MQKKTVLIIAISALFVIILLFSAVFLWRKFRPPSDSVEVNAASNINQEKTPENNKINNSKNKGEQNPKLQADANALLPLFDNMPSVPVYLKDEPVLKGGTNVENGVAYNVCENKNQPTIFVKKDFYRKANQKQLINILKHELTHAYFCRRGIQAGHDARFREKFKQVGGFGN